VVAASAVRGGASGVAVTGAASGVAAAITGAASGPAASAITGRDASGRGAVLVGELLQAAKSTRALIARRGGVTKTSGGNAHLMFRPGAGQGKSRRPEAHGDRGELVAAYPGDPSPKHAVAPALTPRRGRAISRAVMAVFELVIALLVVGALLAAAARRVKAPYPALLALAGAVLALVPGAPSVVLEPDLALALFVAPVLLDAAFDSSPRDLKENWRAVTSLALVAVGLTVATVALAARWLVPSLPWAAAIALGAIVAPPDAAAATAVLKQLRPPHRLLVILEGESLFNDASSLLVYRLAVAAAVSGAFSPVKAVPMLLLVCAGSVVLGVVLSRVTLFVNARFDDIATTVILQFMTTFAVWLLAERLRLSGIITMVVFAITIARTSGMSTPARVRIPSYAVWEVAVFVLNVLAFILVGLQLKPILARLSERQLLEYVVTSAVVTAAVIGVRIVWVMGYAWVGHWIRRLPSDRTRRPPRHESLRSAAVVAWCGMRGIVTLAAALALPQNFPARDLVLFASFSVVLGTLVIQGVTLSPLMRLLRLEDDGTVGREIRLARAETARAALGAVDQDAGGDELMTLLRRKLEDRVARAERVVADPSHDEPPRYTDLLRLTQAAERRTLVELRSRGVIGDDAFHRVEEELDWAELNTEGMSRRD
jgi:Na+/H+ antiporter